MASDPAKIITLVCNKGGVGRSTTTINTAWRLAEYGKKVLVVDLDETLIFSNTLYETFWRAFSKDYKIPFKSIAWLLSGKTKLKNNLCVSSDLNVENLPYNRDRRSIIEEINNLLAKNDCQGN